LRRDIRPLLLTYSYTNFAYVRVLLTMEEDEDVLFEGSPLHEHWAREGFIGRDEEEVVAKKADDKTGRLGTPSRKALATKTSKPLGEKIENQLEIDVAQSLMASKLLVQEDEDFVANFILTEEAVELARKSREQIEGSSAGSFSDMLLISGSLAAAAATVMFLSERTRLAATLCSVLPAAAAAASSAQNSSRKAAEVKEALKDNDLFKEVVDGMLTDMNAFKQTVRKSLNLLQGMEHAQAGRVLTVNAATGAPVASAHAYAAGPATANDKALDKVLANKMNFPILRKATKAAAVELVKAYRSSVAHLMKLSPLEDHADLKDHYIAFVDLEEFGLGEKDNDEDQQLEAISVKELKDVVQLTLIQQSEYLRRFALSFSRRAKVDRRLDRQGLLQQAEDMAAKLRAINARLSKVFEYHRAMGVLPERRQRSLVFHRHQSVNLIPLRSVYTSLFSTGLHLQNSLLRVRELEAAFDCLDRAKRGEANTGGVVGDNDALAAILPSDESLTRWLSSFEGIQHELAACVGCLDEGVASIDVLKNPLTEEEGQSAKEMITQSSADEDLGTSNEGPSTVVQMSESTQTVQKDEIFLGETLDDGELAQADTSDAEDGLSDAEKLRLKRESQQSQRLMSELQMVLQSKAVERERREAIALAAKEGQKDPDCAKGVDQLAEESSHLGFEDSFVPPLSSSSSSSSLSGRDTVKLANSDEDVARSTSTQTFSGKSSSYEEDRSEESLDVDQWESGAIARARTPQAPQENGDAGSSDGPAQATRSSSTPDIKGLFATETYSPYVSLDQLESGDGYDDGQQRRLRSKGLSDSEDSDNDTAAPLPPQRFSSFRRPARPAAAAAAKRERNKTVSLKKRGNGSVHVEANGHSAVGGSGSYFARHHSVDNPLFLPSQPQGFGGASSLAALAAKRGLAANSGREETFGDSSSEEED